MKICQMIDAPHGFNIILRLDGLAILGGYSVCAKDDRVQPPRWGVIYPFRRKLSYGVQR